MTNLQRRPLSLNTINIVYHTADACAVRVDGETFHYSAMTGEHFDELLRYASKDAITAREFLFDGTRSEWDMSGSKDEWQPLYVIGWPGFAKTRVKGAKAAVAALRRFYPLRDFKGEDESANEPATPDTLRVVPLVQPSASEIRQRLQQTCSDWTPGRM